MEERSLRITGTNTTFFNKLTKTISKMLIPTKIGINGMLISMKRNAVIKAYENYTKENEDFNQEELEKMGLEIPFFDKLKQLLINENIDVKDCNNLLEVKNKLCQ